MPQNCGTAIKHSILYLAVLRALVLCNLNYVLLAVSWGFLLDLLKSLCRLRQHLHKPTKEILLVACTIIFFSRHISH